MVIDNCKQYNVQKTDFTLFSIIVFVTVNVNRFNAFAGAQPETNYEESIFIS